ncbi:MAG: DUF4389 domain-containing protein [Deltaproteobacteria bacterium]|nr:DUF4389 domain-containing protein [Deltaproteobacteria bacterium]
MQVEELQLERKETGIRILLTLLFWVIMELVKTVLGAVVLFELAGKCKDVRYSIFNLPHNEAAENKPPLEVKVVAAALYGAVSKNERL